MAHGLVIETEHYTLLHDTLEPLMLRQVPAFLESAYKAYQSQLPQTAEQDATVGGLSV